MYSVFRRKTKSLGIQNDSGDKTEMSTPSNAGLRRSANKRRSKTRSLPEFVDVLLSCGPKWEKRELYLFVDLCLNSLHLITHKKGRPPKKLSDDEHDAWINIYDHFQARYEGKSMKDLIHMWRIIVCRVKSDIALKRNSEDGAPKLTPHIEYFLRSLLNEMGQACGKEPVAAEQHPEPSTTRDESAVNSSGIEEPDFVDDQKPLEQDSSFNSSCKVEASSSELPSQVSSAEDVSIHANVKPWTIVNLEQKINQMDIFVHKTIQEHLEKLHCLIQEHGVRLNGLLSERDALVEQLKVAREKRCENQF